MLNASLCVIFHTILEEIISKVGLYWYEHVIDSLKHFAAVYLAVKHTGRDAKLIPEVELAIFNFANTSCSLFAKYGCRLNFYSKITNLVSLANI